MKKLKNGLTKLKRNKIMVVTEELLKLKVDIPLTHIGTPIGRRMWQIHYFYQSYVLRMCRTI